MMKLVVLCCMFAAATAIAPYYVAPYPSPLIYSAPLLQPYNYRGPLSLAPGQPAEVLGADGRPLDTLEVNLDRSAHFAAKTGLHLLKKRSAPIIAAPLPRLAIAPYAAPFSYAAPISHISPIFRPITYSTPFYRAY